jgi:hypothetical protein
VACPAFWPKNKMSDAENLEAIKLEATPLLKEFYDKNQMEPEQRPKGKWVVNNKLGFFLGIIQYGTEAHLKKLLELLRIEKFEEGQMFSKTNETRTFIDEMFDFYILPFHGSYSIGSRCNTPSVSSRRSSTRRSSAKNDDEEYVEWLTHDNFKNALLARDKACLFCWDEEELHGSHIISQKSITIVNEKQILQNSGLKQKHEVQNGLLLCASCHPRFDKLKRYVDVVDDNLVLKVVNETNDENNVNYRKATKGLKGSRRDLLEFFSDNRQAIESNGEMALYFVDNNSHELPNRKALAFHKTACLIWKMAGGAEPDEEYCSDDDDDCEPVDTAALKRRFKIQGSAETLSDFNPAQV